MSMITNSIILFLYFIAILFAVSFITKPKTQEDYLTANRSVSATRMAISIATTWIWAPAIFVSAEQAYTNGYAGLLWFLVPNVLCLFLFIPFAIRIRNKMPYGYTLSEFMNKTYGKRVKNIYLFQLSALALLSTVVQLVAGGKIVAVMTGIPFWITTIILGLIALFYSIGKGIRTSVSTDFIQLVMILGTLFILVPMSTDLVSFETLKQGFKGINNDITLFNENGITLMLTFGIPTMIGLLSGPFGDQNFYQRIFSVKRNQIKRSLILAAFIFATVPILMSTLGFVASSINFEAQDKSIVNLELINTFMPSWAGTLFMLIVLSVLLSTVNSNLNSFSSLVVDIKKKPKIKDFKLSMVLLTIISIILSNIPLTIIDFFLIYGTLRATTFSTTVLTLLNVRIHESGVFYGILTSLLVGLPTFIYGKVNNITSIIITGSLGALLLSGIVALIVTYLVDLKIARNSK